MIDGSNDVSDKEERIGYGIQCGSKLPIATEGRRFEKRESTFESPLSSLASRNKIKTAYWSHERENSQIEILSWDGTSIFW